MARRRHFIRLLPRLPEARNSTVRDSQFKLNRSRVTFPNILVSVCTECTETIDLPKQSMAQFRELGSWK